MSASSRMPTWALLFAVLALAAIASESAAAPPAFDADGWHTWQVRSDDGMLRCCGTWTRGKLLVAAVVDVLSFSTSVDIAVSRGAEVLPYPSNGLATRKLAAEPRAAPARARGESRRSLSQSTFPEIDPGTRVVFRSPNGAR